MPRKTLEPSTLKGRTIKSIDHTAINTWKVSFEDGSEVWIDTEPGPAGIPALVLYPASEDD